MNSVNTRIDVKTHPNKKVPINDITVYTNPIQEHNPELTGIKRPVNVEMFIMNR
jgi:hypothetical protein